MEPCPYQKQIELTGKEVFGNGTGGGMAKKIVIMEEKFNGFTESFADTKLDIKDIKSSINILLSFKEVEEVKEEMEIGFDVQKKLHAEERKQDKKWLVVTSISMIGIFLTLIALITKLVVI